MPAVRQRHRIRVEVGDDALDRLPRDAVAVAVGHERRRVVVDTTAAGLDATVLGGGVDVGGGVVEVDGGALGDGGVEVAVVPL